MRVLIIEDDPELNEQLAQALRKENYAVDVAFDGEEGKFLGETEPYDAIILDLGLPELDGISVLKSWREHRDKVPAKETPVLILTARDTWSEKVGAFDSGADDYVTKPFHMEEVLARLRAIIRRKVGITTSLLRWGPVTLDTRSSRITLDGTPLALTAHETKIFSYMMHNPDRVFSQTELSEHVYEYDADKDSNTIAVFIARLRKKLPSGIIETVRGSGYRLTPSPS
ncbi:MAG: response regulator transcription factor [Pseudomonadota bacterium]|nr:response regulator transcription factor [Pseudomonadota bacterium]